ncbi:N-acetylglucosamine-6-phosphate deacetylase [Chitinophaga silvisoli]|uniref:N-acetylglucosamine-6-phosphate deacetylase n=1 Tax=Chitinophaga silvisoli TaxID=2291814 RepID=A0A3E1NW26_9BACT|nr:N-acetylglucosamine-6-phosphate deacetylase [Chitinophaga silvisoli]RFM32151.1 N-acetylglucosamine-6-phosphate deacetylase [Chitinophaga silvisoli]
MIKIYNGRIITPTGILNNGTLLIEGSRILEVTENNIDVEHAVEINAGGRFISPGFIDMHVHGGGGHDFMDNTVAAFLGIANTHAQYGTTALMPTTLSCEHTDLMETLAVYEKAVPLNTMGAQFIGLHIEGPYFSMEQKGAQDPRYIRHPDPDEYKQILSSSKHIKRWSAAPELPGALEFGKYMAENGVLPAIAHTSALYDDVLKAVEVGYSHVTHFYSCMTGVVRNNGYRSAGVIETTYLLDNLTVEIIADGKHLPPALLQLICKIKGVENTALITDAMRGAGMPEGPSVLGALKNGMEVIIEDNVAKLPDRSAFAGSVATADALVRNMVTLAGLPLFDSVRMMSEVPARILHLSEHKGSIAMGKDADLTIFDDNINIEATMVNGRFVFNKIR